MVGSDILKWLICFWCSNVSKYLKRKNVKLIMIYNTVNKHWLCVVSYSRHSKATEKKCNCAAKLFAEWKCARNELAILHPEQGNSTIRCELIEMTKDELCFALSRFIHEVRKQNGDNYPSGTLYELIISVQHYLASHGKEYKFLQDEASVSLKNTLASRMKFLAASGLRSERRQAGVINREDEEKCGKKAYSDLTIHGSLLTLSYTCLDRTSPYVREKSTGISFTLIPRYPAIQIRRGVVFAISGRLFQNSHMRFAPKVVDAYENTDNPDRCVVRLYEKYINHQRNSPNCNPALYLRPLEKPNEDKWYS